MTLYSKSWGSDRQLLPQSGNAEQELIHRQRWQEAADQYSDEALGKFAKDVLDDPVTSQVFKAIFGNSPFLSQCLISDLVFARELISKGPDSTLHNILQSVRVGPTLATETTNQIMVRLRKAKQRIALTIGAADIANLWNLEKVTRALSEFADSALSVSCSHLLLGLARQGELKLENPEEPERDSGLIVLGMGKLGARELNYSSDIDLIILFDEEAVSHTGATDLQSVFIRLAKGLVSLMDERTSSGYVFRTDLRLRPDPGATPLAISVRAAEAYYESVGQNWEWAAMIKARPVSGDMKAGQKFIKLLLFSLG